jgi:hypothetical protein
MLIPVEFVQSEGERYTLSHCFLETAGFTLPLASSAQRVGLRVAWVLDRGARQRTRRRSQLLHARPDYSYKAISNRSAQTAAGSVSESMLSHLYHLGASNSFPTSCVDPLLFLLPAGGLTPS